MTLNLSNVTICSADSAYVDLTARALAKSQERCRFADAILFSDRRVDGPFRCVDIPPLRSISDYSRFCLATLPHMIETDHVLLIQWDGYVVDPARWHSSFLKCDYIGAVWHGVFEPGRNVGNGGFSLRSKKLLDALKKFPPVSGSFEDQIICHLHRPRLEAEFGIRFANEKIANRFSYEFGVADSFGFHGFHNMWRYLPDDEIMALAAEVWSRTFDHWKSIRMIVDAWRNERQELAAALYRQLREKLDYATVCRSLGSKVSLPDTLSTLGELERLKDV